LRLSEGAQNNRVVGAHRWVSGCESSPCTAAPPTCAHERCESCVDYNWGTALTDPHPRQPTLRSAGSLQGVPPSCCGRRVAVWRGGRSNRPSRAGKRHDAQAACEPGGGECGGIPDHPPRLHAHRTSPAQALLTILTETCATFDLLSHCHRRVRAVRCALAER
jgi:hypothetical protein